MHIDDQNLVVHLRKEAKLTFVRSPAGAWFKMSG
jgi:hypothetical protein